MARATRAVHMHGHEFMESRRSSKPPRWIGFATMVVALPSMLVLPSPARARARLEPASTGPVDPDSPTDPLRVEVASTIPDAALFSKWIRDRNPRLAEQVPDAHGHEQAVVVELEGSTYDYRLRVVATRDGEPVGEVPGWAQCECNSGRLLGLIDQGIVAAVERLRSSPVEDPKPLELAPELGSKPEPTTELVRPPDRQDTSGLQSDRKPRLSPMGYTGIGLSGLGVSGLVTGIVLATRPVTVVRSPGPVHERSTRKPGIAVAVTGGALLAAGIPLLVIEIIAQEHRSTAMRPVIGPQFVGVSIDVWALRRE